MDRNYLLGVACAISSGALNQFGQILQKKVVNAVPAHARQSRFMRTLLKDPLWITGLFLQLGAGTVFFVLAQDKIGPALVPGLMASGLIVLAVGSVRINKESLRPSECLGIGLMIVGIALLGLSELGIQSEEVLHALSHPDFVARMTLFTLSLFAVWVATHALALRSGARKGVIMGFSNGFPFSLSNFWISPLLAVIFIVLRGKGTGSHVAVFVTASLILVGTNMLGMWQTQMAFRFGQASNIITVQQVPIQTTPILVYFYVFLLTPPRKIQTVFMVSGIVLILVSGFLLGRRQSELAESVPVGGDVSLPAGEEAANR